MNEEDKKPATPEAGPTNVPVPATAVEPGLPASPALVRPFGEGYAVFLFPAAIEALGVTIAPFLQQGEGVEPHVLCREVDTGGAFIEMTLDGHDDQGRRIAIELMVPSNMVRMIMSLQAEAAFGFTRPRSA